MLLRCREAARSEAIAPRTSWKLVQFHSHYLIARHGADGAGQGDMADHRAMAGTVPAERENDPLRGLSFSSGDLRRVLRLEAMSDNASGADKSWVHRAHADAVRHLSAAKRR